nr:noproductstringinfile [Camellia renshanxiangiae]QBM10600.1 noproductstringinfile [Camellia renshanxiangiae]
MVLAPEYSDNKKKKKKD